MKRPLVNAILLVLLCSFALNAQVHFADKKYYLIDSLDLDHMSAPDKVLLDSCLRIYHASASNDTTRLKQLGYLSDGLSDNRT